MLLQHHSGKRRQPLLRPPLRVQFSQEVLRQQLHVAASLTQRRHVDRKHGQAVQEILAKQAVLNRLQGAAVGRRDDAHIGGELGARPDAVELAHLQDAQQPCLHIERHFRHFVEQQRPALGAFEHPGMRADGPGEACALRS